MKVFIKNTISNEFKPGDKVFIFMDADEPEPEPDHIGVILNPEECIKIIKTRKTEDEWCESIEEVDWEEMPIVFYKKLNKPNITEEGFYWAKPKNVQKMTKKEVLQFMSENI